MEHSAAIRHFVFLGTALATDSALLGSTSLDNNVEIYSEVDFLIPDPAPESLFGGKAIPIADVYGHVVLSGHDKLGHCLVGQGDPGPRVVAHRVLRGDGAGARHNKATLIRAISTKSFVPQPPPSFGVWPALSSCLSSS